MPDLTNLIEDIRTTLAYSNMVSPDKMPGYARQYAEECTKLNERLRQCLPHLRGGNVAEAVRLSEASSPNLTETYNLLDFEDRQDWIDVCKTLGLEIPPPLAVHIFQELNDAYLQMASLEPLLKWHRLFNRNSSPTRDRLAVLRSISKADPMNFYWQTDQEALERVRIKELGRDIADTLAKKDMSRLQELYRELTAPGWRTSPPAEYRQKIAVAVLEKNADELMKHFTAFDYDNAAVVYQSMQQVLFANKMKMPAAVETNIRAAVQWIQEETVKTEHLDQFQQEIVELREALDVYTPRQELENLHYALKNTAVQVNQPVPNDLELHYRSRMNYLTNVENRRFYLVVGVFVGALVLVAALFSYAFWESSFAEEVESTLATLQKIESENRIDDIERTLSVIKANVARLPKVKPVMTRLQEMLDKDNIRASEFERYYGQATALLMETVLDREGLQAAKSAVDQADRLKRTEDEQMRFIGLKSKYDQSVSQRQLAADREFSERLGDYRREFNALPRSVNEEYSANNLIDRLSTLETNVRTLLSQSPDISEVQKREGNSLLNLIQTRLRAILQNTSSGNSIGQQGEEENTVAQPLAPEPTSFKDIAEAAAQGTPDDVRHFLDEGGDVNGTYPYSYAYTTGIQSRTVVQNRTLLHHAVEHNPNVEVIKFLVSRGADLNAKHSDGGGTMLHCAAWNNTNAEVLKYLISQGADINAIQYNYMTPLHSAASNNTNIEVLQYLISQGADVNASNGIVSPLSLASQRNANAEILKHLISKGANVNSRDNAGRTALDYASTEEKKAILREAGGKRGSEL